MNDALGRQYIQANYIYYVIYSDIYHLILYYLSFYNFNLLKHSPYYLVT